MPTLGLLLFFNNLSPLCDDIVGGFADILVCVTSEFADDEASFGSLGAPVVRSDASANSKHGEFGAICPKCLTKVAVY